MNKIKKILEKYNQKMYYIDSGEYGYGIDEEDFDKLEEELRDLIEYEKKLVRQQEQDAQDMINAGVV